MAAKINNLKMKAIRGESNRRNKRKIEMAK
jgi:hypothetical protein